MGGSSSAIVKMMQDWERVFSEKGASWAVLVRRVQVNGVAMVDFAWQHADGKDEYVTTVPEDALYDLETAERLWDNSLLHTACSRKVLAEVVAWLAGEAEPHLPAPAVAGPRFRASPLSGRRLVFA